MGSIPAAIESWLEPACTEMVDGNEVINEGCVNEGMVYYEGMKSICLGSADCEDQYLKTFPCRQPPESKIPTEGPIADAWLSLSRVICGDAEKSLPPPPPPLPDWFLSRPPSPPPSSHKIRIEGLGKITSSPVDGTGRLEKKTEPASQNHDANTLERFIVFDITGSAVMSFRNRFYLSKKRDDFSPFKVPCYGTCGIESATCLDAPLNADLLFRITSIGKYTLRMGPHYDYTYLNSPGIDEPGIIGHNPSDIHRHRFGLMSELKFPASEYFLQLGINILRYGAEVVTDPSRGLDVGAESNALSDGSEINEGMGIGFRESFGARIPFWKDGWLAFFSRRCH